MESASGEKRPKEVSMLLDTNILIEHLDAVPSVVSALAAYKESGEEFVISAISVTEVLSHEKLSAGDLKHIW